MRVKFWGVRGSIPAPATTDQFQEKLYRALTGARGADLSTPTAVQAYIAGLPPEVRMLVGGNTSCVEVDTGDATIILDGGSGLRGLGLSLMARQFGRGHGVAHIFLTHAHWDHLQGLPFFAPAYILGNKLTFYAVNADPRYYLEHQQVAPTYFPIGISQMQAETDFVTLREGEKVRIGRTTISNLALYHPGVAYSYRLDDGESVFVYATDGEYKSLNDSDLPPYLEFFREADALAFDAQFSLRDALLTRADWGHSSALIGVDIAGRAQVKQLITFHHDPIHTDEQIYEIAAAARHFAGLKHPHTEGYVEPEVLVGWEGLELFLGRPAKLEILTEKAETLFTFVLAGPLEAASAPEVESALRAALQGAPLGRVLVDLTACTQLDAVGVTAFLNAAGSEPASRLAIFAPDDRLRRILTLAGVPDQIGVYQNRRQASASLLGPARLVLANRTNVGDYRLERVHLVGELGVIYSGVSLRDGHPVLAHVVGGAPDDPVRTQFTADREIWSRMHRPGIVEGEALVEGGDWIAFICARPPGVSWRQWLAENQSAAQRLAMANQLANIVAFIHEQGFFHGGLRPESIAVSADVPPRALVARLPLFAYEHEHGFSAYRAPEHLRDTQVIQRTDVYLLGLILFELLVGVHPFKAESEDVMTTLQLKSSPESPRLRWPEIPSALELLLLKMLALDPADRYPSAVEVRDELARIIANGPA